VAGAAGRQCLHDVTVRQIVAAVVAVVLLTLSLLALRWTVYLPDFDPWGVQIKCGSGFSADLVQATFAGKADQCQHALAMRRGWAIPVAALGWTIVIVLVVPLLRPQETTAAR
jgi:ABC-type Fe3+-siderophore transport system permease subunit